MYVFGIPLFLVGFSPGKDLKDSILNQKYIFVNQIFYFIFQMLNMSLFTGVNNFYGVTDKTWFECLCTGSTTGSEISGFSFG